MVLWYDIPFALVELSMCQKGLGFNSPLVQIVRQR